MTTTTYKLQLNDQTPDQFLKTYWQKKPCLIRNALPNFQAPLDCDGVLQLGLDPEIESRLIQRHGEEWSVQHSPLRAEDVPDRRSPNWTMLVQGVNTWHDGVDQLLNAFRFLPDARLDDIMISFATDGGGVGPHIDSYDVFLLQAYGQRTWTIQEDPDTTFRPNQALKLLEHYQPQESWVLNPGDILYLPPGVAHDGVAIGDCLTYSIGFRAPAFQEIGMAILDQLVEEVRESRYQDPHRRATRVPAQIPGDMMRDLIQGVLEIRPDRETIQTMIGEYLSEPKPATVYRPAQDPLSEDEFAHAASQRGIALTAATRMLYYRDEIFINGDSYCTSDSTLAVWQQLADQRFLDGQLTARLHENWGLLAAWYNQGWLKLR